VLDPDGEEDRQRVGVGEREKVFVDVTVVVGQRVTVGDGEKEGTEEDEIETVWDKVLVPDCVEVAVEVLQSVEEGDEVMEEVMQGLNEPVTVELEDWVRDVETVEEVEEVRHREGVGDEEEDTLGEFEDDPDLQEVDDTVEVGQEVYVPELVAEFVDERQRVGDVEEERQRVDVAEAVREGLADLVSDEQAVPEVVALGQLVGEALWLSEEQVVDECDTVLDKDEERQFEGELDAEEETVPDRHCVIVEVGVNELEVEEVEERVPDCVTDPLKQAEEVKDDELDFETVGVEDPEKVALEVKQRDGLGDGVE